MIPLSRVFLLEAAGAVPDDTTLALKPGEGRVVVLRRSAPDFGLFAQVELADTTLRAPPEAPPVRLTLHPRPGEYALDLELVGTGAGARLVFSYGSHFVAPTGARQRYGSDLLFERELRIGRLNEAAQVVFLPTTRPGTDMLSAMLPAPASGRYLVAAPR